MMTNKEMNTAIKKELKEAGYNTRDFSVTVRDAGYETSIRVYIKNAYVKKEEVEKLLRHWESIDRDERTYEILSGGNTFLFVQYEYGVLEDAAAPLLPISEKVLSNPEKYSGHKIADNGKKEAYITQYDKYSWTLHEREKENSGVYAYTPTYWIRCANDLAVAMWRFKNIGTIYA